MEYTRILSKELQDIFTEKKSKIIVIYGPRQVGKTTLVTSFLKQCNKAQKILAINGDDVQFHEIFSSQRLDRLSSLVKGYDILFIDEAQKIDNIGINLKILYDNFQQDLKIIVTGSSSLDLAGKIKEPLTGRTYTYQLYPLSFLELKKHYTNFELNNQLEERLIFGSYPETLQIANHQDKISYLNNLAADYLYKDVLNLVNIKYSNKIRDLLRLLALQLGSEVSYQELGSNLDMDRKTVEYYLGLLEKAFVIKKLYGFSRNLRKEVNKKPKIYFYDLGIRNALIGNFNYLNARNDRGALWENFLLIERFKRNAYLKHYCNKYFWRTYTGAELDYIEEYGGALHGYEFKWQKTKKAPAAWLKTYQAEQASFELINKDNFLEFISELIR